MPILGAHQSIAGGYYRAAEEAARRGCQCVQLFTHNTNQWRTSPISAEAAEQFREAISAHRLVHPLAHDSYLINLASPITALRRRSIEAFIEELARASLLGIPYVVTHPGAYIEGTPAAGLKRVARALDEIQRRTAGCGAACLLETTAGQGTTLGWQFADFGAILNELKAPEQLGFCLDTCHVFAAGYGLASPEDYRATMDEFDREVGLGRIRAFHLNDSLRPLGARVDRHAHIGEGQIGKAGFARLLADPRFRNIPMYLETPKGQRHGRDLDEINLRVLRRLAGDRKPLAGRMRRF